MSVAITDAITTIAEAEGRFGLERSEAENFFAEWQQDWPELLGGVGVASPLETRAKLLEMRQRYIYQRTQGHLPEGTVLLLIASPLLAIAGFYDPPFRVRAEESVQLQLTDAEEVLQGRIDVLVLSENFWVVVLEAKKTALSVWVALPQTLAYLMANPTPEKPSFALVTNGDELLFVKLERGRYGLSRIFSPLVAARELEIVCQLLRYLGQELSSTL
jgi:hypothetical protein